MSAPTAQPEQPDQSDPPAHQVALQALPVQPALLEPPEPQAQQVLVLQVLPALPAQMVPRAPQVQELAALQVR